MSATVLPPEPAPPAVIHSCPSCSHWLPDGTLACPDCQALTYGEYLAQIALGAQALEQESKWVEARDRWGTALQWIPAETQQALSVQQHMAQIDARLAAEEAQKQTWRKRLGPFAPIALFLIKLKSYMFLLFKLKFLFSVLAYFGLYWALFGWRFALGFTLSIFIHEMGHYVAVRMRGLKGNLPVFIPGFGAYVRWYGQGTTREDLAAISLAGPFCGLLAALGCYGLFFVTHSQLFLVLANLGAWYNLLNLFAAPLPFLALDGAQAAYALSRTQRLMVAGTSLLFFLLTAQGATGGDLVGPHTLWTFLIVAVGMGWRSLSNDTPEKPGTKTFVYFQALVILLGFLLYATPIPNAR